MSDQELEPDLTDLNDDDSWMPDEEALISEDQVPEPDDEVVFPSNGDDSMADDDVEDPDSLDDDSEAVG